MKIHDISISSKYFEPIREGKISLLIFKRKVIQDGKPGDYVLASRGAYDVKVKLLRTYIKSFDDITDDEARKAGFLNKDFLEDELIGQFNIKTQFDFDTMKSGIHTELFFLVELAVEDDNHYTINNPVKVNLYSKEYNKEFYNPEYDTKPWRDLS